MFHQVIETLNSRVALRPRYENFIGGKWVAPVAGGYFDNISPITGKTGMPDRALAGRRYRACARRRAQGEGCLGQHRASQARRDPRTRSPTAWRRTSRFSPRSRPSTTASRSARRPSPIFRSPSIISAISPLRPCAGRRRCRRSITTPSPITITSRSASSARSSRGTSRS